MNQIQSLNLFNINRRSILAIIFLALFGGMAFFAAQQASAAESAACHIRIDGTMTAVGNGAFEECADAIIKNGDTVNGRYQVGTWGSYTVATNQNRQAWYRLNGRRRFSYYGSLPIRVIEAPVPVVEAPAQVEPAPVDKNGADTDGDRIVGEADRCPAEAETMNGVFDSDGCPDTIDDLLKFAEDDLNDWWQTQFDDSNLTYYPPTKVVSYQNHSNPSLNNNAFYTSGGHYIAYDIDLMSNSLHRHGDFAPVAIMAHEWGHLVQANLGIREEFSIYQELQADCLAGSYATYLQDRGNLEEGDLEEGLRQMFSIGDSARTPWFHENAHGTGEQRYEAFLLGFENDVDTCIETYSG
ncbi:MAG: putative metalloprotease [Cellvibrionaceae bacterium]|jgi:predicted metalloprotease